jgi:hypothetical protein
MERLQGWVPALWIIGFAALWGALVILLPLASIFTSIPHAMVTKQMPAAFPLHFMPWARISWNGLAIVFIAIPIVSWICVAWLGAPRFVWVGPLVGVLTAYVAVIALGAGFSQSGPNSGDLVMGLSGVGVFYVSSQFAFTWRARKLKRAEWSRRAT